MMGSVPSPWSREDALAWMDARGWHNPPGFFLAICLGENEIVGGMGVGPAPDWDFGYFIGRAYAGRGYATEAGIGVLAATFALEDGPDNVSATCFQDNPASARVLEKLGFLKIADDMGTSRARLEPAPVWKYRLTRSDFEGRP